MLPSICQFNKQMFLNIVIRQRIQKKQNKAKSIAKK
jgi:hypothetical protein